MATFMQRARNFFTSSPLSRKQFKEAFPGADPPSRRLSLSSPSKNLTDDDYLANIPGTPTPHTPRCGVRE